MAGPRQSAWPGREVPAQYRDLARTLVRDHGWFYDPKGRGRHPMLRDPKGVGQTSIPITPSDYRGYQNWLSQLRALGADLEAATGASSADQRRRRQAAAKVAAHERELAELEAELAKQPPARPVPDELVDRLDAAVARANDKVAAPQTPARTSRLQDPQQVQEAKELLAQGYHVDRVVARTGVAPEALRRFVADDGYAR